MLQPRRRVGRQVHRDNPNVNSAEQLWRTTMYFAFLDHVNNELERRFPGDQQQMMLGQYPDTQQVRSLGRFGRLSFRQICLI